MLPGRNGYQVCADLREAGDWTPILMLTAKDGELDEAEALDTGADDYLTKPFSFPVLVARVRALLRRTAGRDPVPVAVGDLRIDPGRPPGVAGRRRRSPSPPASSTCSSSSSAGPGRCCRKEEILAGVWDYDFDGDPNIVEVYVGRLRRKLDEPFDRRSIETVRGAGYRLGDGRDGCPDGPGPHHGCWRRRSCSSCWSLAGVGAGGRAAPAAHRERSTSPSQRAARRDRSAGR